MGNNAGIFNINILVIICYIGTVLISYIKTAGMK
jgi:hypothetical protein